MAWDNAVVTNNGIALLQQVLAEETLTLDSAAGGSGIVNAAALMAQTALINQKQTCPIVGVSNVANGKRLNIQITNQGLSSSYTMQQLGIWAHVATGPSVLFAILQDNTGITIPSETDVSDFSLNFYAVIDFSNDAEFQLTIDPSVLVTVETLNTAISAAIEIPITQLTDTLNAHAANTDIHTTGEWKANIQLAISDLITFSQRPDIFVTPEDKIRWDAAAANAIAALLLAQKNAGDITDLMGRVKQIEDSLFNGITANPFNISFDTLDGVIVDNGIWNETLRRIEC